MFKSAIVTTLIKSNHVLDSFIRYHQSIGFSYIFLFFDDPQEIMQFNFSNYENVIIVPVDETLRARWKSSRLFTMAQGYKEYVDIEVMARQMLNVQIAIEMSLEIGIDWILHIDSDELFFCPGKEVNNHFQQMENRGLTAVQYLNFEAIVTQFEVRDFFKEMTFFKKHPALLISHQHEFIKTEQRYNSLPLYFLFYMIGKSSARINPELLPKDVHSFYTLHEPYTDPDCCVLHYPICGFSNFLTKYKVLGKFNDKWFGHRQINLPFHLLSRDVYQKNDESFMRDFYKKYVIFPEGKELDNWLKNDIIVKIDEPFNILNN